MKKLSFLLACWVLCTFSRAQVGNYFLSHHAPEGTPFGNVCFDLAQDGSGMIYVATKSGILEFDGRQWDIISGSGAVYGLHAAANGDLFWAGAKGYGTVAQHPNGQKYVQHLSDSGQTDFFQVISVKDEVFFLREQSLVIHEASSGKTREVQTPAKATVLTGVFDLFGEIYVTTLENTTYRLVNGKWQPSALSLRGDVVFSSRIDDQYVLGTSESQLLTCSETLVLKEISLADKAWVEASVVVGGAWINRQLLALGTLRGGVIFVNPITGQTLERINYSTGLPDNEIYDLMNDRHGNIWVGHDYGFTQIAPFLPLRSFSHYPGLQGNLLCAYSFHDAVYVGTSQGLFKLEKENVYEDIISFVTVPVKSQLREPSKQVQNPPAPAETTETESRKRGLFSFLRKNRKKGKEEPEGIASAHADTVATPQLQEEAPRFRTVKKVERMLLSSQHVFKKVSGIEAKITHLAETGGRLLAGGLAGIFEVDQLASKVILEEPIRSFFSPPGQNWIIASTYHNDIRILQPQPPGWREIHRINNLQDQIHFMFEGTADDVWLCGLDKLFRIRIDKNNPPEIQLIGQQNPTYEKTVGAVLSGEIMFANAAGFYRFDNSSSSLVRIDSLENPKQYFAHAGNLLYRDEHGWRFLGQGFQAGNLQLLNLFEDLRFITADQDPSNLWMISSGNELFKFYGDKITVYERSFPVFLKSIDNENARIDPGVIRIDQETSAVTFEVVQPDYINPRGDRRAHV